MKKILLIIASALLLSNPINIYASESSGSLGTTQDETEKELVSFGTNDIYHSIEEFDEVYEDDEIKLEFVGRGEGYGDDFYMPFWLVKLTNNTEEPLRYEDILDYDIHYYYEDESSIYPVLYYYTPIQINEDLTFEYKNTDNVGSIQLKPGGTAELMFWVEFAEKPEANRMWLDIRENKIIEGFNAN